MLEPIFSYQKSSTRPCTPDRIFPLSNLWQWAPGGAAISDLEQFFCNNNSNDCNNNSGNNSNDYTDDDDETDDNKDDDDFDDDD